MAIDYNAGISSLDAGAGDITYTGNEGPKSPQEEMQIAGGEYNRVLEILEKIREGGPLSEEEKIELESLIRTLTAKGIPVEQLIGEEQGREGIQMASAADPMLQDDYEKYLFEMDESHPEITPMSFEQFRQQAVAGMAIGGRAGYRGGQLVQPGIGRPGYRGRGAQDPRKIEDYREERDDIREQASVAATQGGKQYTAPTPQEVREMIGAGPEDLASEKQTIRHRQVVGQELPPQLQKPPELKPREKLLQDFQDHRPPVTGPWWTKPFQPFSDWTTERNRRWFVDNVLRAGKYKYGKYGTLGYEDIDEKDLDLEKAYQQYMSDRMAGKIDATGNVHPNFRRENIGGEMVYVPSGAADETRGEPQDPCSGPNPPAWCTQTPDPDPDPDPGIPTDPVTGTAITSQYHIPGASNFYSNLPSALPTGQTTGVTFDPTAEMLKYQYAADGGRMGYAGGGITDLRQGYFIGKLVKGLTKPFKGITRGIKKFSKSKAGKMAIMAALMGAPMGGGTWFGPTSGWGGLRSGIGNLFTGSKGAGLTKGKFLYSPVQGSKGEILDKVVKGSGEGGGFWSNILGKAFARDPSEPLSMANLSPLKTIGGLSAAGGLWTALTGDKEEEPEWLKDWKRKYQASLTEFAPIGQASTWEPLRLYADGGRTGYRFGGGAGDMGLEQEVRARMEMFNEDYETALQRVLELRKETISSPSGTSVMEPGILGNQLIANTINRTPSIFASLRSNTAMMPMSGELPADVTMPRRRPRPLSSSSPFLSVHADGGRIGYAGGGNGDRDPIYQDVSRWLYAKDLQDLTDDEYLKLIKFTRENDAQGGRAGRAQGGRIGYAGGGNNEDGIMQMASAPDSMDSLNDMSMNIFNKPLDQLTEQEYEMLIEINMNLVAKPAVPRRMADLDAIKDSYSQLMFGKPLEALTEDEIIELEIILKDKLGGPFTQKEVPQSDRAMAQEGGLMDLGGMEKDYRNEGGFVPIGGQERADDVPARLSKNEFVFTADAVRAAGGGDIDAGAEVMENVMENLEQGGQVSEESQGLEGARNMFATAQRLEGVL